MRLLQAHRHSAQQPSSPNNSLCLASIELSAEGVQSRHDAQMLTLGTVPADPYTVWLERREADRASVVQCCGANRA